MVLFILIYGFTKNTNIYDSFINGSKESFKIPEGTQTGTKFIIKNRGFN